MKNIVVILAVVAFGLATCQGNQQPTQEESMSETEKLLQLLEETDDGQENDFGNNSENQVEFEPCNVVSRYQVDEAEKFKVYKYENVFEAGFPEKPEYEEEKKSDHSTFSASTIYEGTIYSIDVDEYTEDNVSEMDEGFVKFVHNEMVSFMSGDIVHSTRLLCDSAVTGYYTCYSYSMDEKTYNVDYVTYGKGKYIVHLEVTSRPEFEAGVKVLQYINSFRFLK